jgi:hypothetical protein
MLGLGVGENIRGQEMGLFGYFRIAGLEGMEKRSPLGGHRLDPSNLKEKASGVRV